jgi:hypothetical protein
MSATNNMTVSKPCMYYDSDFPFAGLKKPTAVNTDDILKKQYNYSKATVSHGETIKEVPEYVPKKKYMWTSFVDFFKQKQRFGRHPFFYTPRI